MENNTHRTADALNSEPPVTLFSVTPTVDTETLLANASETLSSAVKWPICWHSTLKAHSEAWSWRFTNWSKWAAY